MKVYPDSGNGMNLDLTLAPSLPSRCAGKYLIIVFQKENSDLQHLPIAVVQRLSLWPVSSYQYEFTECRVGKRCADRGTVANTI